DSYEFLRRFAQQGSFAGDEDGVARVGAEGLAAEPGVPAEPRTVGGALGELTLRHIGRLQDELHVDIELRTDVETDAMHELVERLSLGHRSRVGKEARELGIRQRTHANSDSALHIPDALAYDDVAAELIVEPCLAERGAIGFIELQPLPLELLHMHG